MASTMPLLSLESAAMLCRADSRGRLGLLFRRRVGPLLFRAGGGQAERVWSSDLGNLEPYGICQGWSGMVKICGKARILC
jgi:hypothetical protein